jgi:hypothetical protein
LWVVDTRQRGYRFVIGARSISVSGSAASLAVALLVLAAPAPTPAQDAGVSGIPPGPANARGLNGSVMDPSGIGNAAKIPPLPPPDIRPVVPPTYSGSTSTSAAGVVVPPRLQRTRASRHRSARARRAQERLVRAQVKENDRLLDRGMTSICRGC